MKAMKTVWSLILPAKVGLGLPVALMILLIGSKVVLGSELQSFLRTSSSTPFAEQPCTNAKRPWSMYEQLLESVASPSTPDVMTGLPTPASVGTAPTPTVGHIGGSAIVDDATVAELVLTAREFFDCANRGDRAGVWGLLTLNALAESFRESPISAEELQQWVHKAMPQAKEDEQFVFESLIFPYETKSGSIDATVTVRTSGESASRRATFDIEFRYEAGRYRIDQIRTLCVQYVIEGSPESTPGSHTPESSWNVSDC